MPRVWGRLARSLIFALGALLILGSALPSPATGADNGSIRIVVDDAPLELAIEPRMEQDCLLVPLRPVWEALGAVVSWDQATRRIAAVKGATSVQLQIGAAEAVVNGAAVALELPPRLVEDRTLVPLSFIRATVAGASVWWEESSRTVAIVTGGDAALSPEQQNRLGHQYYQGRGLPRDLALAAHWFGRAAERGYAPAQVNLGALYESGEGVGRDLAEAVRWYRLAAAQGEAAGQNSLGWMYQYGLGVEQDYQQAEQWYRKAAEQGYGPGQNNLGWLCRTGQGTAQNYAEALRWFGRAADQGLAEAEYNLGVMYQLGLGVEQDRETAVAWFGRAAGQGQAEALALLERLGAALPIRP